MSGSRRRLAAAPAGPRTLVLAGLRWAGMPLVAVALLLTVALVPSGDETASVREAAVAESSYACAGAPRLVTGQVTAGDEAEASGLPEGEELTEVADPSRWVRSVVADLPGGPDAVTVTQRGERSGAVGYVYGRLSEDDGEGLVVAPCSDVVDEAWYTGLGSDRQQQSRLVLTNLSDTPAVADVRLWSPEGPVDAVASEGIVVDPGSTRVVRVTDLAASESELALQVERRRGALAVTTVDTLTDDPSGSEIVTPSSTPAAEQIIGGLPPGGGGRSLELVNPGESTTRVQVEALGAEGAFVPEGLDDVRVEAGSTVSVDLPEATGEAAVGLRLVADIPVTASVRVDTGGADVAVVEATPAWSGDAVVPLGDGLPSPDLALTAVGGTGRIELEAFDAQMQSLGRAEVEVPQESTRSVDLGESLELDDAVFAVVRQGDAARVSGSAVYRDGDQQSALALTAAPREALVPPVRFAP